MQHEDEDSADWSKMGTSASSEYGDLNQLSFPSCPHSDKPTLKGYIIRGERGKKE